MARNFAKKYFQYNRETPDDVWLSALSIFQTVRTISKRSEMHIKDRTRKESLGLLSIRPDMSCVSTLRVLRKHLREEFGVTYDGFHNRFKNEYEQERTNFLFGFMEGITAIFANRLVELDLVLPSHIRKVEKVAHAIRDIGKFDPIIYERGREEAYRFTVLAVPYRQFSLLEE